MRREVSEAQHQTDVANDQNKMLDMELDALEAYSE